MSAKMTTFSKVDVSKMDLSEYEDEPVQQTPHPSQQGISVDGMGDMGGGMSGAGLGLPPDDEDEEWKACNCESRDKGTKYDLSKGKKKIIKKLIRACPDENKFEPNPQKGWEVDLVYSAHLLTDESLFDEAPDSSPKKYIIGSNKLPEGVEKALRTMKSGEICEITISDPQLAFGAEETPSPLPNGPSIPPSAKVRYRLDLRQVVECDSLAGGKIKRRMLKKAKQSWETPQSRAEVCVSWSGYLLSDGAQFQAETQYEFALDDPNVMPFWKLALAGQMKRGEVCELEVESVLAYGHVGSAVLGVPENAAIRVTVSLDGWKDVEVLGPDDRDDAVLKVIHVPGEGWEKPKALYEVVCKFHVAQGGVTLFEGGERTLALGAFPAEKGKDGKYIRTEQIGEVGFDCDAITAEASAYTGGALIGKALELQIKSMQKGESSEVRCSHAFIGGDCLAAKRMCVHTELVGWSKVEPVPHTNEAVIRKVLNEAPKDSYERPNEDAQVTISYTARDAATQQVIKEERELTTTQGEGRLLRCVDAAVREMKKSEVSLIRAPAAWAYGAYEASLIDEMKIPAKAALANVEVTLELHDFVRLKEMYDMSVGEKLTAQAKAKERANAHFKRDELRLAVRQWERSNSYAPSNAELAPQPEEDRARAKKTKVACFVNIAACKMRMGEYEEVIDECTAALEIEPESVKALFRRGQAQLAIGELRLARSDLVAAAKAEPKNKGVRDALQALKLKAEEVKSREKAAYGGMFK